MFPSLQLTSHLQLLESRYIQCKQITDIVTERHKDEQRDRVLIYAKFLRAYRALY